MALLSPRPPLDPDQIHQVLKESGLAKTAPTAERRGQVSEILDDAGLSKEDLAKELQSLVEMGSSEAIRLRAAELAFRLHGSLAAPESANVPSFQIIIKDSEKVDINPILIPR